ncbi:hypothetical protein BC835DRAFT_1411128 [Cytidiella melzeri]|nr:hypothetical protein BC835DRAFT_1411128 [Cytidiella melzeri]
MSPLISTAVAGINTDNTIGALLFGGLIGTFLYGVTTMQTVFYYQKEHSDGKVLRVAVPALWILETIDTCLIFHFLYSYLILNYGNFGSVTGEAVVWSVNLHFFVIAVTQAAVRSLFAARIRKLSQSWAPVLAISLLCAVDVGSNIALTIRGSHEKIVGLGTSDRLFDVLVCVNFASSFAGDALVALCLCFHLQRTRAKFRMMEQIMKTLAAYVITTGLLTTVVQSVALVLFLLSSKNFVYLAVLTQVSKLYVNAYLAMLNDRERIRELGSNNSLISPSRVKTEWIVTNLGEDIDSEKTSSSKPGARTESSGTLSGSDVFYAV